MKPHWTYATELGSDIEQGDVLVPTDGLKRLLAEVHPHFSDAKYNAFLVVTQTCDMVRRQGTCKASHISLAVVRPLDAVISKLAASTCTPIAPGLIKQVDKGAVKDLMQRLLNQNEQALGLFYLHNEHSAGIAENSVGFLRISFALRAEEHYESLLEARRGTLTPEFKSKLGWLVGNLYARVGTTDWSQENLEQVVAGYLGGIEWVSQEMLLQAKEQGVSLADLPLRLPDISPYNFKKQLALSVENEMKKVAGHAARNIALEVQKHVLEFGVESLQLATELIISQELEKVAKKLGNRLISNKVFARAVDKRTTNEITLKA